MSGGSIWAQAAKRPLTVAKMDGILGITGDTPFEQFMAQREALRVCLGVLACNYDTPVSADDSNEHIREQIETLRERERARGHGYGVACCNLVLHGTTDERAAADAEQLEDGALLLRELRQGDAS